MKKLAILGSILFSLIASSPVKAQTDNDYIELLRTEIRTNKKAVIAMAMDFQSEEASRKFWAIYQDYERELAKIGDKHLAFLKEYGQHFQAMEPEKARELINRAFALHGERERLIKKYVRKLEKEMAPIIAARFLQIERQIHLVADANIAVNLPLVQPKRTDNQS